MATPLERPQGALTAVIDDGNANVLTFDTIAGLRSAISTSVAENSPSPLPRRRGSSARASISRSSAAAPVGRFDPGVDQLPVIHVPHSGVGERSLNPEVSACRYHLQSGEAECPNTVE